MPLRPHESTKTPRRTIVRKEVEGDISSTSSTVFCLGDLAKQLDTTALSPWLTKIVEDEYIKCCLSDQVHTVPTYTVIVDPSLGITTYVYNWPVPDDHGLYSNYKRSLKSAEDLQELLSTIETSKICKGVELCNPCSKAAKKRTKASPAKSKASLAACGPEKLRATVKATRLECKILKEQLVEMQEGIQEQGVRIDQSLEQDIRKIMDGQNLDATPHMKFFWEEQMKLLQSSSCGRRYHLQIIRFALSLHGKSPSAYESFGKVVLWSYLAKGYYETIQTISHQRQE